MDYLVEVKEQEQMRVVVKGKDIKKKKFFFSKNKIANLVLNKSFSNVFITMLDLKYNFIICKSSGMCHVGNQKKIKKSSQIIETLINNFISIFELYNIKMFNIILKIKFSSHVVILVKELTDRGYIIKKFFNRLRVGHNGMRGRKFRRV
jgi:ribosomal protein S11